MLDFTSLLTDLGDALSSAVDYLTGDSSIDLSHTHLPGAGMEHGFDSSAAHSSGHLNCGDHHFHYDPHATVNLSNAHSPIEFGLDHPEYIAGFQGNNPHCGIHSVGNIIQTAYGTNNEAINERLYEYARQAGFLAPAQGGYALHPGAYEPILEQAYGIPSTWTWSNAEQLVGPLAQGRMALVIGDAHELDPQRYPPQTLHAFNITGARFENSGLIMKGLDSNIPGKEIFWPAESINRSMQAVAKFNYGCNALITDVPLRKV